MVRHHRHSYLPFLLLAILLLTGSVFIAFLLGPNVVFCIKKLLTEYLLNLFTITENTHPKLSKSQHFSRMLSVPTGENDEAWEGEAHTAAESCMPL